MRQYVPWMDRRKKDVVVKNDRRRLSISGEHRKLVAITRSILIAAGIQTDKALDEVAKKNDA